MTAQAASTNDRRRVTISSSVTMAPSTNTYTSPSARASTLVDAFSPLLSESSHSRQEINAKQLEMHSNIADRKQTMLLSIADEQRRIRSRMAARQEHARSVTHLQHDQRPLYYNTKAAELQFLLACQRSEIEALLSLQTLQTKNCRPRTVYGPTELHRFSTPQPAEPRTQLFAPSTRSIHSLPTTTRPTTAAAGSPLRRCSSLVRKSTGSMLHSTADELDEKQRQSSIQIDSQDQPNLVDKLVKDISAFKIHQPPASNSLPISPPLPPPPVKQKRSRTEDDEDETTINERLALLYLDPPPPPTLIPASASSTSASAPIPAPTSTAKSKLAPMPTTSQATTTTTPHTSTAKASKDCIPTTKGSANVKKDDEIDHEVPLPYLIDCLLDRHYETVRAPTNNPISRCRAREQLEAERHELNVLHISTSISWRDRNPGLELPVNGHLSIKQQQKDGKRTKSQQADDDARIKIALHSQRAAHLYQKESAKAKLILEQQLRDTRLEYERAMAVARTNMEEQFARVLEKYDMSTSEAWGRTTQQHRELSQSYNQSPSQYKQGAQDLVVMASYPSLLEESDLKYSCLLENVGDDILGQNSEDKDGNASEDHAKRKRVKREDVKHEPVDEKMSDATTATTSSSTTSSINPNTDSSTVSTCSPTTTTATTASATSTTLTSSNLAIFDVTHDMQHKLTFNPTTSKAQ